MSAFGYFNSVAWFVAVALWWAAVAILAARARCMVRGRRWAVRRPSDIAASVDSERARLAAVGRALFAAEGTTHCTPSAALTFDPSTECNQQLVSGARASRLRSAGSS